MNTVPVLVSLCTAVAVGAVVISGLSALGLRGEIERLEARLPERPDPGGLGGPREPSELGDPAPEWARMARVLEDLERRLARLEARPGRELVPAVVEPVKSGPPEKDVALRAEMEELLGLFADGFDWNGDTEKLQRFYELAHETDLIDEKIAELEAGVAANPGDLERRMQLADTYVAKLMTIQGPEQGLWGLKAEQEWRTIVDLDENHWESTFNTRALHAERRARPDLSLAGAHAPAQGRARAGTAGARGRTHLPPGQCGSGGGAGKPGLRLVAGPSPGRTEEKLACTLARPGRESGFSSVLPEHGPLSSRPVLPRADRAAGGKFHDCQEESWTQDGEDQGQGREAADGREGQGKAAEGQATGDCSAAEPSGSGSRGRGRREAAAAAGG